MGMGFRIRSGRTIRHRVRSILWRVLVLPPLVWTFAGPLAVTHASAPAEISTPARYERRITRERLAHLAVPRQPTQTFPQSFRQSEPRPVPIVQLRTVRR